MISKWQILPSCTKQILYYFKCLVCSFKSVVNVHNYEKIINESELIKRNNNDDEMKGEKHIKYNAL